MLHYRVYGLHRACVRPLPAPALPNHPAATRARGGGPGPDAGPYIVKASRLKDSTRFVAAGF